MLLLLSMSMGAAVVSVPDVSVPADTLGLSAADSIAIAQADSLMNSIELDEVVVTAKVKPIIVRGDTTVINASSFGIGKGDDLSDLVGRIPGMEYDKESKTLKYNGKVINEIMVNGRKFMGSNLSEGLRILSADLVDKIKVYDKRDEEEAIMKIRRGDMHTVLDLQTSRNFNGAMSAQTEVARGDRGKKQLALMAQRFDMGGDNFMADITTGNKDFDTRYKGNRNDRVSVNVNKDVKKDLNIGGSFSYNRMKNGHDDASYVERYLPTANNYEYAKSDMLSKSKSINGNLGLRWKFNENTLLTIMGSVSNSNREGNSESRRATFDSAQELNVRNPFEDERYGEIDPANRINAMENVSRSKGDNRNARLHVSFVKKLGEKGPAINLLAQMSNSRNNNRSFAVSRTDYFRLRNSIGGDSILYRNQYTVGPSRGYGQSFEITISQSLTEHLSLDVAYELGSDRNLGRHEAYDLSPFFDDVADSPVNSLPPGYESGYIDSLSNHSVDRTVSHKVEAGMTYTYDKWIVSARCSVRPQRQSLDQKTGLIQADTVRNSVNFSPHIMAIWNKNGSDFNISYEGQTSQPPLSSLLSLTDNSNPLFITHGNPDLKASYSHSLNISASSFKTGLSGIVSLTGDYNSQTSATYYNTETGGTETYPVNINGNRSADASLRYFKSLKPVWISGSVSGRWSRDVGLVSDGQSEQPQRSVTNMTGYRGDVALHTHDKWGHARLKCQWVFNRSFNRLQQTRIYTRNYIAGLEAAIKIPGNIEFSNDVNFTYRNGTNVNSREDSQVLWNMQLKWRFLKNKDAALAVNWYDILSDTKNISRNSSTTGFYESYRRQIGSYFLVSFTYRFRKEM